MPNIKEESTRKQNSVGVEQEKARIHAEVVPTSVEDVPEKVSVKEYVDRRFAQQAAENGRARAETQKDIEKVRAENKELCSEMRAGFAELDAKFAQIDAKFAQIDAKFAQIEAKFVQMDAKMDTKFAQMDTKFAQMNAKMEKMFAELRAENAKQRVEDKASQLNQLRWIVGTIVAIGALVIAAGFFT